MLANISSCCAMTALPVPEPSIAQECFPSCSFLNIALENRAKCMNKGLTVLLKQYLNVIWMSFMMRMTWGCSDRGRMKPSKNQLDKEFRLHFPVLSFPLPQLPAFRNSLRPALSASAAYPSTLLRWRKKANWTLNRLYPSGQPRDGPPLPSGMFGLHPSWGQLNLPWHYSVPKWPKTRSKNLLKGGAPDLFHAYLSPWGACYRDRASHRVDGNLLMCGTTGSKPILSSENQLLVQRSSEKSSTSSTSSWDSMLNFFAIWLDLSDSRQHLPILASFTKLHQKKQSA